MYIFSSTAFSELIRIPTLIEHYSEHQVDLKTLTFADFLYMHYVDYENHSDDRDSDLPFQSHSNSALAHYYIPLVQHGTNYLVSNQQLSVRDQKKNFYDVNTYHSSSYLSAIWQPPRNA